MKLSLEKERQDVVCDLTLKDYPRGLPLCLLSESRANFACLKNPLLVTLANTVQLIKKFFLLDEQNTFRDRRQQCANLSTQEIITQFTRYEVVLPGNTSALEVRILSVDRYCRILSMNKTPSDIAIEMFLADLTHSTSLTPQ
jgi:hypothetical protein